MTSMVNYSKDIVDLLPELHVCCLRIENLHDRVDVTDSVNKNIVFAKQTIDKLQTESAIDSISHWRRAYRKAGIEPTKFRMAAESLLRRLRKQGNLPETLHPLVLICNALSVKHCLPIAVLDTDEINGNLWVSYTKGGERYLDFNGNEILMPSNEVSFIDEKNNAHARKWSHKQSGLSVVRNSTKNAIIIIEALSPLQNNESLPVIEELKSLIDKYWPGSIAECSIRHSNMLISNY
ncbi:B3/B4 domain-containing protein [Photobacterium sp. R1]